MTDIVFVRTATATISGTGTLTGDKLREFANNIPTKAKITLQQYKNEYVMHEGSSTTPWKITATWEEE